MKRRLTADAIDRHANMKSLFGLTLLIDVILMPFTSTNSDMSAFVSVVQNGIHGVGLYRAPGFSYPPVVGYLLSDVGVVARLLGISSSSLEVFKPALRMTDLLTSGVVNSYVTSPIANFGVKFLVVVPQFLVGWMISNAILRLGGDRKVALGATAAWMLNPLVLFEVGVHGGIDVWVGASIFGALCLALEGRPLMTGMMVSLGVLTKIVPVFAIPILCVVVVRNARDKNRANIVDLLLMATGGLAFLALVVVPEMMTGSFRLMIDYSLLRTSTGLTGVGGISIFALRYFRSGSGLTGWSFAHANGLVSFTSKFDILIAIAAAGWIYLASRKRLDPFYVFASTGAVYLVVLITSPITNPQYLLWVLPVLIILCFHWFGARRIPLLLGALGTAFYFALLGPLAMLLPLNEQFDWPSINRITSSTLGWYLKGPILWGSTNDGVVLFPVAAGAVLIMSWLLVRIFRFRVLSQDSWSQDLVSRRGRIFVTATVLIVLVLAGEGISLLFTQTTKANGSIVAEKTGEHFTTVRIGLDGVTGVDQVHVVANLSSGLRDNRKIYDYVDQRYPVFGTSLSNEVGLPYWIDSELQQTNYRGSVATVDAGQLAAVFRDLHRADQSIVVLATGVFPATVFSRTLDLVDPWLNAGGTFVWGGDVVGSYSSRMGAELTPSDSQSLGLYGASKILSAGTQIFPQGFPDALGSAPSYAAKAFGILYDRTDSALSLSGLTSNAHAFGYQNGIFNSIVVERHGKGRVVTFGGGVDSDPIFARDLMSLLISDSVYSGRPLTFKTATVMRGPGGNYAEIRLKNKLCSRGIRLSVLDANPLGTYMVSVGTLTCVTNT